MSPNVARYFCLELGHRYGNYEGLNVHDRKYTGNPFLAELEARALQDVCAMFRAGAADLRALSGHVAGSAAIMGLCRPNDLVFELNRPAGGHRLAAKLCEAKVIQLRVQPIPFDGAQYQVDVPATVAAIKRQRPRLVIMGSSNYLFPTPLEQIAEACKSSGAVLLMDASHVLGLIAGGVFPQPLDEGADLMIASSHKTLGGPQGGIILAKTPQDLQEMLPALYPGLITNHHLMRMPSVIALLAEWRTYGAAYAKATVANAIALADALDERGVPVLRTSQGPTGSHTIIIKTAPMGLDAAQIVQKLETGGILTGTVSLPPEQGDEGIRLGVQEVTRMGLVIAQVGDLAQLIGDAIAETDGATSIENRVRTFTQTLQEIRFCHGAAV